MVDCFVFEKLSFFVRNWLGCWCDSLHLFRWKHVLLYWSKLRLVFGLANMFLNVMTRFLLARWFWSYLSQLQRIALRLSLYWRACLLTSTLQILQEICLVRHIHVLLVIHTDVRERYWTAIEPQDPACTSFIQLNRSPPSLLCIARWFEVDRVEFTLTFGYISFWLDEALRILAWPVGRFARHVRPVWSLWVTSLFPLSLTG